MVVSDFYTSDEYLAKNPDWHVSAAPWKSRAVLEMIKRHNLKPKSVCEIGCGAGEILRILQDELDPDCEFLGYDIAPQAIEMAKQRENARLHCKLGDFMTEEKGFFDLILLVDVLEHFENCFEVLREIKSRSTYKILQLPLDIAAVPVILNELIDYRHTTGHLHFFTKDIALEILRDAGYEVVDHFYSMRDLEFWSWAKLKRRPYLLPIMILKLIRRLLYYIPRKLLFAINQDFAVRLMGGWRLMVLIK